MKQIEEMARAIGELCVETSPNIPPHDWNIAAYLYDKGYRKQSEVASKIFEEIEKCMKHDYISSIGVYNGALELRIAELKKKYTEG